MEKNNGRKFILYILIIVFILSLGALTYRVGSDIYTKKQEQIKEEKEREEKIKQEQQEIKDKIKEETELIKEKQKIDSFNNDYEFWAGSQVDNAVKMVIDSAIKNYQKNPDHLIEFIFDGTSYGTEPNSIRSIKNSLKTFNNYQIQYYEISLNYDENGYVNKVTIETR